MNVNLTGWTIDKKNGLNESLYNCYRNQQQNPEEHFRKENNNFWSWKKNLFQLPLE